MMNRSMRATAVVLASLAFAGTAAAQEYPSKPIKVIVPFAAGGGTDVIARIWGDVMSARLKQRFLIENQAGGNGAPGTIAGIKSNPDGYTLVMGVASTMAINPHMLKGVGYQATDLQPVAMLAFSPWLMAASAKVPYKTASEMIAYAKANPGQVTMGSWTATGQIGRKALAIRAAAVVVLAAAILPRSRSRRQQLLADK